MLSDNTILLLYFFFKCVQVVDKVSMRVTLTMPIAPPIKARGLCDTITSSILTNIFLVKLAIHDFYSRFISLS